MRSFVLFACLLVASTHGKFTMCRLEAYCTGDTWTAKDFSAGDLPDAAATHYERGDCRMVSYSGR